LDEISLSFSGRKKAAAAGRKGTGKKAAGKKYNYAEKASFGKQGKSSKALSSSLLRNNLKVSYPNLDTIR
jgi:hypothetical protein